MPQTMMTKRLTSHCTHSDVSIDAKAVRGFLAANLSPAHRPLPLPILAQFTQLYLNPRGLNALYSKTAFGRTAPARTAKAVCRNKCLKRTGLYNPESTHIYTDVDAPESSHIYLRYQRETFDGNPHWGVGVIPLPQSGAHTSFLVVGGHEVLCRLLWPIGARHAGKKGLLCRCIFGFHIGFQLAPVFFHHAALLVFQIVVSGANLGFQPVNRVE